jgi:hypothetical protein
MVHLAQAVHLSCTDTYMVLEQTKLRFRMTHITEGVHGVREK